MVAYQRIRRVAAAWTICVLVACSQPSPQQQLDDAEIAALAPLKAHYADVVMGFDVKPETTLTVSVDLQHYIDTDDDTLTAMRKEALARWRAIWRARHPHAHAVVHVRFIDFVGRNVAQESAPV
ncbi:MAG TPA: hypothetical protein VGI19_18685 [Candidatus Cybelea sp.]|jgi:hypothetical protein